jgi:hypothetical protein
MSWEQQHAEFRGRAYSSNQVSFAVAEHVHHEEGYSVTVKGMKLAPTILDRKQYADHGDLIVTDEDMQITWRYEVKGLSAVFTCAEDWPAHFGGKVFVDTVKRVDAVEAAGESPRYYYSVNQAITHVAIIETAATRGLWKIRHNVTNKNTGMLDSYYYCPIEYVSFRQLVRYRQKEVA